MNGGYSSNDEACPYYEDIIVNFEMGHEFLLKEYFIFFNHNFFIDYILIYYNKIDLVSLQMWVGNWIHLVIRRLKPE